MSRADKYSARVRAMIWAVAALLCAGTYAGLIAWAIS